MKQEKTQLSKLVSRLKLLKTKINKKILQKNGKKTEENDESYSIINEMKT